VILTGSILVPIYQNNIFRHGLFLPQLGVPLADSPQFIESLGGVHTFRPLLEVARRFQEEDVGTHRIILQRNTTSSGQITGIKHGFTSGRAAWHQRRRGEKMQDGQISQRRAAVVARLSGWKSLNG